MDPPGMGDCGIFADPGCRAGAVHLPHPLCRIRTGQRSLYPALAWGIAYLIVTAFQDQRLLPHRFRPWIPIMQRGAMGLVALFVIVNHAIPMY